MGNSASEFMEDQFGYRDRQRSQVFDTDISTGWITSVPTTGILYSAGSAERCVDHNIRGYHRAMRIREKARHGSAQSWWRNADIGHSFAKESVTMTMPSRINVKSILSQNPTVYRGFYGVFPPSVMYRQAMSEIAQGRFPAIPSSLGTDRVSLWAQGSTAIRKSLPDVPEFSLFRFVGELRAGLPKVPLHVLAKERKLRNAGGEYLNVQFGIIPLISDLQNFLEAVSDPRLRAAVKHQLNEEHRVRKTIDKGVTSTSRALTATEMNTTNVSSGRKGTLRVDTTYRIWSSCSFVYLQVTELDRLLSDLDQKLGGVGAVPTAIDIWNLIPWSWLVDWFTNFNHVITNLSYLGRDGLLLQRGYLMAHYQDVETSTQSCVAHGTAVSTTGVRTFDRQYRVKASPFGFGYTWKDFDPFQLSILGALGVSRMRF